MLWRNQRRTYGMGCASSKVGQQPPDQEAIESGRTNGLAKDAGERRGEAGQAVESRPALPVVESALPSIKGKPPRTRGHTGQALRFRGEAEVEGETVTDESGLQMRTPRSSNERGLHFAAKSGDLTLVQTLLGNKAGDRGNASNSCPSEGTAPNTPLVDVDERGMWGNTPLIVATQYAYSQVALTLIQRGANPSLENERQATALHHCCAQGLLDVSRALLDKGAAADPPAAAVHHPAIGGGRTAKLTPLLAAVSGGHIELVRLLLEHGAQANGRALVQGADGEEPSSEEIGSPLVEAARRGYTAVCLLLVDNGASIDSEDTGARTPLMHAIHGGHESTCLALLDASRYSGRARRLSDPVSSGTNEGHHRATPLHLASEKGLCRLVKALIAAGARIEARNESGATPLLHACRKGMSMCARELLSRGADPTAQDNHGNTPLKAASSQGDGELLGMIEEAVEAEKRRNTHQGSRSSRSIDREGAGFGQDNAWHETTDGVGSNDDQRTAMGEGSGAPAWRNQEKGDDNEEEENEDVLTLADWDREKELDDCEVWIQSTLVDDTLSGNGGRRSEDGKAARVLPPAADDSIVVDDGDEDVLMVDDYEDVMTEMMELEQDGELRGAFSAITVPAGGGGAAAEEELSLGDSCHRFSLVSSERSPTPRRRSRSLSPRNTDGRHNKLPSPSLSTPAAGVAIGRADLTTEDTIIQVAENFVESLTTAIAIRVAASPALKGATSQPPSAAPSASSPW